MHKNSTLLSHERLNPMVHEIGEAAQRQNIIAGEIEKKVDKADGDMKNMNKKLKDVMQTERNSSFICKLILFIVLLTFVGLFAQQVNVTDLTR